MMKRKKKLTPIERRKSQRRRRSKLKELQNAVRMWQDLYQTVFEESRDALFISTPEGQLIDINPSGYALFGYESKDEILQINMEKELFGNAEQRRTFHKILAQNGTITDYEIASRTKNGETIIIQEMCTAIRNEKGDVVAYRGIIRDVTGVRNLQQQLLQAQKMETVGRFASSMAHDFNNLLSAISGYCELMNVLVPKSGQLHEYLLQVERTVDRGTALTRQLLTFGKKHSPAIQKVNLNNVLDELKVMIQRLLENRIQVHFVQDPELWKVVVDREQLEQIILNIALNAREATSQIGSLTFETSNVETSAKHHTVKLALTDDGLGTKFTFFFPRA
jgi:PAS domain S-box-containing protein